MHFVEAKGILSNENLMNIYRGCTHGCIYCDTRSKCYNFKHKFEDIEVKQNAPKLLRLELKSKREKCMVSTGAMTDPYIHLESELHYTKQCLEVIEKLGFGVAILTKSDRVLNDLELLKAINEKSKCVVQFSLSTYDDELCKIIEPNVCTTKERLKALKILKENGIPTTVWLMPFLPYINDNEDNLRKLLEGCIEAGVKGILCFGFGLTIRDGNREYLYSQFDKHFKGMSKIYEKKYGGTYSINSDNNDLLYKIFKETCIENDIMYKPKEIFKYLKEFEDKNSCTQMSLF